LFDFRQIMRSRNSARDPVGQIEASLSSGGPHRSSHIQHPQPDAGPANSPSGVKTGAGRVKHL
jgi:hypothetical protein